jgi:hypothetical protein
VARAAGLRQSQGFAGGTILYFNFSLYERKIEIQKIGKYRSAEG